MGELPQWALNEQQLKLFISVHEQPIPDIVNQSEQSIYSCFKFYFNDDALLISTGGQLSALHIGDFENGIDAMFAQWLKDREQDKKDKETNFIAFVQYWVRNTPQLLVRYSVHDEVVAECVTNQFDNLIYKVAFSLTISQHPFSLKPANPLPKVKPPMPESMSSPMVQKRLHSYFAHFSKLQTISSGSNPLYRNNGGRTFEEIGRIYSTLNLQQWICFARAFELERAFEDKLKGEKQRQREQRGKGEGRAKNPLPVRTVKWGNSLQFFKNLFEKHCDNTKNLGFQAFESLLKKLFQELFLEQDQLIPLEGNCRVKPQASKHQKVGLGYLKVLSESQHTEKLRSLGIFVPTNPTIMPGCPKSKSYSSIKPRYLELANPPLMSPKKIEEGKGKGEAGSGLVLPGLGKGKQKLYTLEGLMTRREPTRSNQSGHTSPRINKNREQEPQPPVKTPALKSSFWQKQNSPPLGQMEEEPDEYLDQYYHRNQHGDSNGYANAHQMKVGQGQSGSGIMARLDARIDRVHRKML